MKSGFIRRHGFFASFCCAILLGNVIAGAQSGPRVNDEVVAAAAAADPHLPDGPVKANWDSIKASYTTPLWWRDAKFGIFMHWGLYAVPAHGSEWYETHMYSDAGTIQWHTEKFGAPDKFGYKDFIPMFTEAQSRRLLLQQGQGMEERCFAQHQGLSLSAGEPAGF